MKPDPLVHTTQTLKPKTIHPNAALRRREGMIGLLFLSPWLLGFLLLKLLPILLSIKNL